MKEREEEEKKEESEAYHIQALTTKEKNHDGNQRENKCYLWQRSQPPGHGPLLVLALLGIGMHSRR